MNTTILKQEDCITLLVEGRIDTITSPALSKEFDSIIETMEKQSTCKTIAIDFQKVEYISSAGLRVMLAAHKTSTSKNYQLNITHVSQEVLEVFNITGFSNILNITEG